MIKKILVHIFIGIITISSGFALLFPQSWLIENFGKLMLSIGLVYLFVVPAVTHIKYSKNKSLLISYLITFLIINIGRHYTDFYLILNIKEYLNFMIHPRSTIYLTGLTIWLVGAIGTSILIVKMIRKNISYQNIIAEKIFKIIIGYIILILLMELPLYNWHGDFFGQSHGHSFWYSFHFH